jgi:ABC transport system ATP-binding/permease protein
VVKDFWGTYSEYKEEMEKEKNNKPSPNPSLNRAGKIPIETEETKKKLSYMEKRELDILAKEIHELEKQRDEINKIFQRADIAYDDIRLLSEELGKIVRQLEQKEYRWFELSARE